MLYLLKKDKFANFGFLGSTSYDPVNRIKENRRNTKRFRIYRRAIENTFGEKQFSHFEDINNSTYLVLNNNNDGHEDISESANKMFEYLFPDLEP
ncbi:hypothetical protein H8S90_21315 [Olivibacter sp. SDN3]|uniref:hypothetical protein n=1 Tax=Olivibacter sp. SDN3 TaxID=2764720 RepID=UPI001651272F|nr:hypothetical protein [Olivibacter sp. SDN3]QNL49252.1 hypothetical protein H8S90_21315 [Olivibacter sp. SDN3]